MNESSSPQSTLSVVVCSYNGANKLPACFDALSRQRVPIDVLVVDDGSTDGTDALARSYGFSVIRHETNKGISAARNTGLTNATSSIVAYCDDDCSPPTDWTEQLLIAWNAHPDVTVLGGMVEVDHPVSFTQRYLEYRNPLVPAEVELSRQPSFWYRFTRQFRPPRLPTSSAFPVYSVVGANMSMHRIRALEAGAFDKDLLFGEGEEMALCEAVRRRFGESSVIVDPHVVMAHRFDPSMLKTWRRSFAYGRGAGERWRKSSGWPSLPVVGPTAIVGTVMIAPFSWPLGLIIGLATLTTPCLFWVSRTTTRRRAAMAAYPFAALIDDLVSVLGFARGISKEAGGVSKLRRG
ncbi:MAG TPA: glycosyltransferase [Acidimicrobiales bacterium]|jgi:glycosyltransferase involved in cell wall biosynthesis|nr:glycosyltransferase [Acidimicrobiales bacterium]